MSCVLGLILAGATSVQAGGSGLNVAVVVNQASSNSLALGNYYAERRGVPPQNIVRVNWPSGNIQWTTDHFTNTLLNPLLYALAERGISNQIEFVLLSMDLPYRVTGIGYASTTASLFYDFKPDPRDPFSCPLATNSANSYFATEEIFRLAEPDTAQGFSFLTTMITGETLDFAKRVVDSGVEADETLPTNRIVLQQTSDSARSVRHTNFDHAIFELRVRGGVTALRTNSDVTTDWTNLLGFETGLDVFSLTNTTFVPGALADHLTSFGGYIFEGGNGQTTLLEFLRAGAAGSYGAVVEPCAYVEKFPLPLAHFYQTRGFTLAESYLMSLANPYHGLIVGDPLSAPFRRSAQLNWSGAATNATLSGTTNLTLTALSTNVARPIQQLDLFVDGKFFTTLTNIAPAAGNIINATIKGRSMNYTVPGGATIKSVAAGMTAVINQNANVIQTGVRGAAIGDRVRLRAIAAVTAGSTLTTTVSSSQNTGAALTTFITASRSNFLDSVAEELDPNDQAARNHLYLSVGATNLVHSFALDTAQLTDGFHELTAVAYEGTHVRTQTRATLPVLVRNTPLNATLTLTGADALTAVETNFTVQVAANTNTVTLIELFSTGGRLAAATNQSSATFTVSGAYLGIGRHPLYAVVTVPGAQFRTTNAVVRVTGVEPEIHASLLTYAPPTVAWPGVTGRRYQILSTDDAAASYLPRDTVIASNSVLNLWTDPLAPTTITQRFYRVGVSP
jgi:uncharacterized protein (TIGR03790 family)